MKTIIFIAVIAFAAAEFNFQLNYYKFFEDLDLNSLLDNDQEFDDFVNCVLNKGPCKKLYESYKDQFSEAVKSKCQKCTPYQKHMFWLFIQRVLAKSPENFILFRIKYDPENKYFNAMMEELQHKAIAI